MSSGLDVRIVRPWWAPWRSTSMDRDVVASVLEPLLGDVSEVRRPASVVELTWEGRRTGTQWMVFGGKSGISSVAVELWEEAGVDGPQDEYLDEVAMVVRRLRELTGLTGARLTVDGGDMTDEPFDEVIDALT